MTPLTTAGIVILVIAIAAIFLLPRRWAPAPLLTVTCYMVLSQGIQLASFNFFSIRLVILAGLLRVLLRRERLVHGMTRMDRIMGAWAVWALVSCVFHVDPGESLTFHAGLVFNTVGIYALLRVFCQNIDDVTLLCRIVILLLIPVSLEMVHEKTAASNLFAIFGGVPDFPNIREGKIRAQGPFAHSILGGTVGAVMLPICIGLWSRHRLMSWVGIVACVTIVVTSASSGPLLSAMFAVLAMMMWRLRFHMKAVRRFIVAVYLLLAVSMDAPPYYLLARIDLSGGSTGYHRARLIESSIDHLGEWWFAGTDYTRHWMATGVSWSPNHTDITNHYLMMGVLGGLPLMGLFIVVLTMAFSTIGRAIRDESPELAASRWFLWSLGASLFAHAATCISVSYFDQSFVFLYVTIASIASVDAWMRRAPSDQVSPPYSVGPPAGQGSLTSPTGETS